MSRSVLLSPDHALIKGYYASLKQISRQKAAHEGAVRAAFQELLTGAARLHKWDLITESADRTSAGSLIRYDGKLFDENHLPRGWWEAKDTADSLEREVAKKREKKYSLDNTIFENSERGILYQNGDRVFDQDIRHPAALNRDSFGSRSDQSCRPVPAGSGVLP